MASELKKTNEYSATQNGFSPVNMQPDHNGGVFHSGITLREYFAAMALQGILANKSSETSDGTLAFRAVEMADSLLFALER